MKKKNSSKIALKKVQQRDFKKERRKRIDLNKFMKVQREIDRLTRGGGSDYYWEKL